MPKLHVNIDHIATLRQARGTPYPDPIWGASLAELAGAHGITAHLREDRRHISDRDMRLLRQTVRNVLNMEMASAPEVVAIALEIRPDMVTLVPEKRQELTTEGGLELTDEGLRRVILSFRDAHIPVSLFINPEADAMARAADLGAHMVELHTGVYCETHPGASRSTELKRLCGAAEAARKVGLKVAAGHGLDYSNVIPIAQIPEVEELNIGHAIIARSVLVGLDRAVRDMLSLITP